MQQIFYIFGTIYFLVSLNIIDAEQKYWMILPIILFYFFKYLLIFNIKFLAQKAESQKSLNRSPVYQYAQDLVQNDYHDRQR